MKDVLNSQDFPERALYLSQELDQTMQRNGFQKWEIGPVCSRNLLFEARAEIEQWKKWGIIEIAIRNPNVASYMKHWEDRAIRAERLLEKINHPGQAE